MFATLANGVDERIVILQHCDTGYYNISKALRDVASSPSRFISWKDWFQLDTSRALIAACEAEFTLAPGETYFSVKDGPNEYQGMYVHRYLFDHILAWASASYSIHMSRVLDEQHDKTRTRLDYEQRKEEALINIRRFQEQLRTQI